MIVISSFTYKLFPRAITLCDSMKPNIDGLKAVVYYEDVGDDCFPSSVFEKFNWINWISLNETDKQGLDTIDSFEQFKLNKLEPDREARYVNFHARFWFRKIASTRACLRNNPDNDLILWTDADCVVAKPLLNGCIKTANNGDIGHIKRRGKPTDTGLILFNLKNDIVKEFIEEWYQLYITGRIFNETKYWGDHYALDYVMKEKKFLSLKSYALQRSKGFTHLISHRQHGHIIMARLRSRINKSIAPV